MVNNTKLSSFRLILYLRCCKFQNELTRWWLTSRRLPELLRTIYALQSTLFVLFCLHNHLFNPFMELQCSKLKISLQIDDFVLLNFILPKLSHFLQVSEPLRPIYFLQSTHFVLHDHFFGPVMDLDCSR